MKRSPICILTALLVSITALSQQINTDSWKLLPQQVVDSEDEAALENALLTGSYFTTATDFLPTETRVISMELPIMNEDGMMIFTICHRCDRSRDPNPHRTTDVVVNAYTSDDSTDGTDGTWNSLGPVPITERLNDLQKFDIPKSLSGKWIRIEFINNKTINLGLKEFGLYEFHSTGNHNYFLLLGASIMEASGGHTEFIQEVDNVFGSDHGYEPVVFNLAVSGARITQLRNNIDSYLAAHPKAKFVMIHIGGNDVSARRPLRYANLDDNPITISIIDYLQQVIQKVHDAGKIAIVSRLTFRDYRSSPQVEDGLYQAYGSLPFNWLVDDIIKDMTPEFFNETTGRSHVDLYELTLNDQAIIAGDGIHPKFGEGHKIINYWVKTAMKYIYTGEYPDPIAYTEILPNLTDSLAELMTIANTTQGPEDVWNARLIADQIADNTVRTNAHGELDLLLDVITPVELVEMNVTARQEGVALSWTTASELNNDYFTIERGSGAHDWSELSRMKGGGTSNNNSYYSFFDAQPIHGTNFYRISQTDFDGTHEVLGVKRIDFLPGALQFYPNPVQSLLKINARIDLSTESLHLFGVDGKSHPIRGQTGANETLIELGHLKPGTYFLKLLARTGGFTQKIVVESNP